MLVTEGKKIPSSSFTRGSLVSDGQTHDLDCENVCTYVRI